MLENVKLSYTCLEGRRAETKLVRKARFFEKVIHMVFKQNQAIFTLTCYIRLCAPKIFSRIFVIRLRYYVRECKAIISRGAPRRNEAHLSGKRDFFEKFIHMVFKKNEVIFSLIYHK